MAFDNEVFSAHRMKRSFICSLWYWSNVYSGDRDRSLIDFLTWMRLRGFFGMVGFLELLASFLAVPLLYTPCILPGRFDCILL